jgi:hypothetical protein
LPVIAANIITTDNEAHSLTVTEQVNLKRKAREFDTKESNTNSSIMTTPSTTSAAAALPKRDTCEHVEAFSSP